MPCRTLKIGNATAIVCSRGQRTKPCYYCGMPSDFLCDYPVGKTKKGKKKDCDRALCKNCTQKGVNPEVDFCREHFPLAQAAYERRMNKTKRENDVE